MKIVTAFVLALALACPALAWAAQPNIVVIMTDDQSAETLSDMGKLTYTRLVKPGTSFRSAYVLTPLCGPSRASFLTGRYSHNHQVLGNGSYSA